MNVYQDVQDSKKEGFTESRERVLRETDIETIDHVTRYHGQMYYHVVSGTTDSNEQMLAYVNQSKPEQEVLTFLTSELVQKSKIENQWKSECGNCQLLQSNYGIRSNVPLVELSYFDTSDRLTYRYYRLDNGELESGVSFSDKYKQ